MKKYYLPVLIVLVLAIFLILPGCNGGDGTGEVITEKKDLANFNSIDIGSAFEVDITRSDTYSVVISADESLFDYIDVSQTGTKLKIYLNPRHIFTDFTLGKRILKAEITMPALHSLEISGASKGTVTGFSSSADLNLNISGATTLKLVNVRTGITDCEVSGASKLSGNLTAAGASFDISGASNLEISGSSGTMNLDISGASSTDLTNFAVKSAVVDLSGASSGTVHVTETLDVDVSGASRLYFIGNPTLGHTDVSGASTIKHKD